MRYIKIYEEYSSPNSVTKIAEIVYNRLLGIVETTTSLDDTITIHINDIYPDFPVYALNCYFKLNNDSSNRLITGRYLRFVNKTEHASVKNVDGTITIGFELTINLNDTLDNEDRLKIHSLILHEIFHCFQDSKMKNFSASIEQSKIIRLYMNIYQFCGTNFLQFLILAYACSSKTETDAYLAQSNICKSWANYLSEMNKPIEELFVSFDLLIREQEKIFEYAKEIYGEAIGDSFIDVVIFYRKMILNKKDYIFRKLAKI